MKRFSLEQPLLNYHQRVKRLRFFTCMLLLALFIPASVIAYLGFEQLHKETLMDYQRQTDKVTTALNKRLFKKLANSNTLASEQFGYYYRVYNPITETFAQTISPLAEPDNYTGTNGLLGYFELSLAGQFSSPVWPYVIGSVADELAIEAGLEPEVLARRALAAQIQGIITSSQEIQGYIENNAVDNNGRFNLIADVADYFIMYRAVSVGEQIKIQGYVLDRQGYMGSYVERVLTIIEVDVPMNVTLIDESAAPDLSYFVSRPMANADPQVQSRNKPDLALSQQFISKQHLNWPFADLTLKYETARLENIDGSNQHFVLNIVLFAALGLGCFGFYRIGMKQLKLAEQRLNFVSSVSHELKTPLTSIRMYAEMLQTSQVLSAEHQRDYYDFIFSESERLSRLIDNILQLAKLSQPQHSVEPEFVKLSVVQDMIRSKVSTMLTSAGFELCLSDDYEHSDQVALLVDTDALSQVVINLTDNAIKFFDEQQIQELSRKRLDVRFYPHPDQSEHLVLEIRDYGMGIEPGQEQKLFELFYRGGSELTRTTQGTGIGLALVKDLVLAQQGKINVVRANPGLALQIVLVAKSV